MKAYHYFLQCSLCPLPSSQLPVQPPLPAQHHRPQPGFWQWCGPGRAQSLRRHHHRHHHCGAAVAAEAPDHLPSPPTPLHPWRLVAYLESSASVGMQRRTRACDHTHVHAHTRRSADISADISAGEQWKPEHLKIRYCITSSFNASNLDFFVCVCLHFFIIKDGTHLPAFFKLIYQSNITHTWSRAHKIKKS